MGVEEVKLPTYETLLTEAIRSLAVDSGTVSVAPPAGIPVLQDSSKNWAVDVHRGRLLKVIRGAGTGQLRVILSNTATVLTANAAWTIPLDTSSVYVILGEDFATALLNMNLRQWGGIALTGRDVSLDLANLDVLLSTRAAEATLAARASEATLATILAQMDVALSTRASEATLAAQLNITLSALRDAICAAAPNAKTLNDLYGYLARYGQLPAALSAGSNLKVSHEEAAIAVPADIQARYNVKSIRDIAPGATGTFWLPAAGNIDLSNFKELSWFVYAPTTATMVIAVYLNISHDGGTTWRRAEGYTIADADFVRGTWNSIHCPLMLAEAKLEVVIGTAFPAELDLMCIRKA